MEKDRPSTSSRRGFLKRAAIASSGLVGSLLYAKTAGAQDSLVNSEVSPMAICDDSYRACTICTTYFCSGGCYKVVTTGYQCRETYGCSGSATTLAVVYDNCSPVGPCTYYNTLRSCG